MKEHQYCVVRVGIIRTGEVLSISDSLDDANKTAKQFKVDGVDCKVYSYQEIKKMDALMEKVNYIRKS